MFNLKYEPLIINKKLKPWEIAVIPWDTESFGFGVSILDPSYSEKQNCDAALLNEALNTYSKDRQVPLILASIPSEKNATSLLLQKAGFYFIDLSLSVLYENSKDLSIKNTRRVSLSPAIPEEVDIIIEMAGRLFQHGRYHLDLSFPRHLADQRYRDWIGRCLNPENLQQILAVKFHGTLCGFSVVEQNGPDGYMHLHAIDSKWRGKKLGADMILQSLSYLYGLGAKTVGTKISASNLRAINMHSRLNGHFTTADRLLHWHQHGK